MDFGQSYDDSQDALVHTRIILTPLSAKTLFAMLHELLEQYESKVGPIAGRRA